MRTACLLVPDLPLAAELRAHPALAGRPLAVAAGPEPRAELVAVSPEAARRGIRAGLSVAQGRAACANLAVRVASPALERAAREALLDAALSVSPRALSLPPSGGVFAPEAAVLVDAAGTRTLFASEAGFAGALAERARRLGLRGSVGVAASREVAHLAARAAAWANSGVRVVPDGAEAAFLAPLPFDLLDPDDALIATLTRFGMRRIGDLARLPRRSLAARLGPEALQLADLARGAGSDLPLPQPDSRRVEEAVDLEHPIDRLEPLGFVLRGMLSRLAARLEVRGLACGDLDLELILEGGERDARRVGVAAPTGDVRVLVRLVGLALETHPPGAAVEALCLACEGRPARRDQLDLFRPAGPAPAVLDRTLAELEALCGDGRIGAPRPADDHHPDALRVEPFAPRREIASAEPGPTPTLALRALRPPVPARVQLRGGHPAQVESAVARGEVLSAAGPWRTSGGWWSPESPSGNPSGNPEGRFAVDHYDVQISDGSVARLRHDRLRHTWSVDALYD